jgi:asparagine synthase (glutamine-hydrolysing)
MNEILASRGPDGQGTFRNGNAVLGHTRLAIVDVNNREADQPMENENYVLTFNGEIYNHREIREELEKQGVSFRTDCDTEVLLEGFSVLGEGILDKINGQFAFAIYNKRTGETVLARDRTAMKPLYFSIDEERVDFSSHPTAITSTNGFQPSLERIAAQLLIGSAFAAGEEPLGSSIYEGIQSLKPGEYASISKEGQLDRKRYYNLPITDIEDPLSLEDAVDKLGTDLTSAIKKRIPGEVKVGVSLSGGLDSSIIAAVTADNYDDEIVASCIRYTAQSSNPDYEHAKILADNRDNVTLVSSDISPENFLNDLEEMVDALGIHDSIRQLAMFRNYKVLAKNGVKVVLTGEGADEFNWGYWHKFPGLKSDQEECETEEGFRKLIAQRKEYVEKLFNDEINLDVGVDYLVDIYSSFDTSDSTRRMMGLYAIDFLGFLNKANDRCAMAQSLEARCPFQDVDVIETCLEIPQEYQIREDTEKYVLREAFKDTLPEEIYARGKAPLPAAAHIDYHKAIAQEFGNRIENVDESFWQYFNRDTFSQIAENYTGRIEELESTFDDPEEAGARLMEWRPISKDADIVSGRDVRTNDVFKLLTTMVWYDQNIQYRR